MIDQQKLLDLKGTDNLKPEVKKFLNDARAQLKGCERRKFMANVVRLLGKGGRLRAEHELGWDRKTINKGAAELNSGFDC